MAENRRFTLDLEQPALVPLGSPSHAREGTAASIDATRSAERGGGPGYRIAPHGQQYGPGGRLERDTRPVEERRQSEREELERQSQEWEASQSEIGNRTIDGREVTEAEWRQMQQAKLEATANSSTLGSGLLGTVDDAFEIISAVSDIADEYNNPSGMQGKSLWESHQTVSDRRMGRIPDNIGSPPAGSDSQEVPAIVPVQPAWQVANLSARVKRKIKKLNQPFKNSPGFFNQRLIEPEPLYAATGAETVMKGLNNSFIIMGRDRVGTSDDGYGHGPSSHAGAIDIIAGLSGQLARNEQSGATIMTNKSFALDSARIYLSQKCDIDDAFALTSANSQGVPPLAGKSAIALKADGVRVIARSGIKLVTGTDVFDASSQPADIAGVDIIAGNNAAELQPMVRGHDLMNLLSEQFKFIEYIIDELYSIRVELLITEIENLLHFHISTIPGAPTIPAPSPTKLMKVAKYATLAKAAWHGLQAGQAAGALFGAAGNSAWMVAFRKEYLDYSSTLPGTGIPLSKWNNVN